MSWQDDPRPITWTNISSTIAKGGTAQVLSCGLGALKGFILQNPSTATESLFFEPNGVAGGIGASFELQPGGSVQFGPGQIFAGNAPSIYAVTTNHQFICLYGQ